LLNIYNIIFISGTLIVSTYLAVGRPDILRWFGIVRMVLLLVLIYPAILWFGPAGAAGSKVLCMVIAGVVQQINLSKLIGLPARQYLATMYEGLVVSAVVCIPAVILRVLVGQVWLEVVLAAALCGMSWGFILWRRRAGRSAQAAPAVADGVTGGVGSLSDSGLGRR